MKRPVYGAADSTVAKINVRQGVPLVKRSPAMDRFLSETEKAMLYDKWPTEFILLQGGVKLVTCNMVSSLSWGQLVKAYGTKQAKIFKDIAKEHEV